MVRPVSSFVVFGVFAIPCSLFKGSVLSAEPSAFVGITLETGFTVRFFNEPTFLPALFTRYDTEVFFKTVGALDNGLVTGSGLCAVEEGAGNRADLPPDASTSTFFELRKGILDCVVAFNVSALGVLFNLAAIGFGGDIGSSES